MENKTTELEKALFKFMEVCPKIEMKQENPFHHSKYANLETIMDTIKPHLKACGLAIYQVIQGKNLITHLKHIPSGEMLTQECPILNKEEGNAQQFGSGLTYSRRYSISTLLSLITDGDDDGNTASGLKTEYKKEEKKEDKKEVPVDEALERAKLIGRIREIYADNTQMSEAERKENLLKLAHESKSIPESFKSINLEKIYLSNLKKLVGVLEKEYGYDNNK